MAREPKNFDHLLGGKAKGLSDLQLKAHFTLYQGYVKKLNEIEERLGKADRSTANYSFSEYTELRRREPVAFNGTYLHEAYFDNLGEGGQQPPDAFKKAVTAEFGSWENYVADLKAMVTSAPGWALTTWSFADNRIRNNLIQSEHHVGLMVNQCVLLAVDAWEHAFFMDYGTNRGEYFQNVFPAVSWTEVGKRLQMTPLAKK